MVKVVFPELRERVEQLGLEFFDVDLRWGVPEKDANCETANSREYCRQWNDRVEPFFVCILGRVRERPEACVEAVFPWSSISGRIVTLKSG